MAKCYEITLQGTYQNQDANNRLSFVTDNDLPGSATAVAAVRMLGFAPLSPSAPSGDSILDKWLAAQTDIYHLDGIVSRNLFDPTDFYTVSLNGTGWNGDNPAGADGEVSFIANKLQTNRIRLDVRRGSLALTPLTEESYDAEGTIGAGGLTALNDLAAALNDDHEWTDGSNTTTFINAVFGKLKYTVPNRTDGRQAYKYYPTLEAQLAKTAQGVEWSVKPRATSQVSRKIGKGS